VIWSGDLGCRKGVPIKMADGVANVAGAMAVGGADRGYGLPGLSETGAGQGCQCELPRWSGSLVGGVILIGVLG